MGVAAFDQRHDEVSLTLSAELEVEPLRHPALALRPVQRAPPESPRGVVRVLEGDNVVVRGERRQQLVSR